MYRVSLGLLALLCTGCAGASLAATPRIAQLDTSGEIGVSSTSVSGTTDLDDLGLDGDDSVPGVRLDAGLVFVHVIVSGLTTDMSGDGTLTADLSQGGVTLPVGTNVDSRLGFDTLSAYGTFDFVPGDTIEVGLGLGVTGMSFDGKLTSTDVGTPGSVSFDEDFALPVLAVTGAVNVGPFEFSALLAGMQATYSGDDLTYYEADLMAAWRFIDSVVNARLALGYRHLTADAEFESSGDEVEADVTFSGPYLGLTIGI